MSIIIRKTVLESVQSNGGHRQSVMRKTAKNLIDVHNTVVCRQVLGVGVNDRQTDRRVAGRADGVVRSVHDLGSD